MIEIRILDQINFITTQKKYNNNDNYNYNNANTQRNYNKHEYNENRNNNPEFEKEELKKKITNFHNVISDNLKRDEDPKPKEKEKTNVEENLFNEMPKFINSTSSGNQKLKDLDFNNDLYYKNLSKIEKKESEVSLDDKNQNSENYENQEVSGNYKNNEKGEEVSENYNNNEKGDDSNYNKKNIIHLEIIQIINIIITIMITTSIDIVIKEIQKKGSGKIL